MCLQLLDMFRFHAPFEFLFAAMLLPAAAQTAPADVQASFRSRLRAAFELLSARTETNLEN